MDGRRSLDSMALFFEGVEDCILLLRPIVLLLLPQSLYSSDHHRIEIIFAISMVLDAHKEKERVQLNT